MQLSTLADRLRELRGNESRKAFSLKYGIHEQSLIRYEKGIRTPDNDIIRRIAEGEKVSFDWLRSGDGPKYTMGSFSSFSDMSDDLMRGEARQPIENTTSGSGNFSDMSENLRLRQKLEQSLEKMLDLQERIASLVEEKAELQVSLERAMMTIERRDMRIHELEKENAGLREAQKESAALQHDAEWRAG